jgi:hypothetical protein
MATECLSCRDAVPCSCPEQIFRDRDVARAHLWTVGESTRMPATAIETGDLAALRPMGGADASFAHDPNVSLKRDLDALRQEIRETKNILLQILGELRRR